MPSRVARARVRHKGSRILKSDDWHEMGSIVLSFFYQSTELSLLIRMVSKCKALWGRVNANQPTLAQAHQEGG